MKETKKKAAPVTLEDIKQLVLDKAKASENILSQDEVDDFIAYIHRHLGAFDSKVSTQRPPHIANETDTAKKVLAKEICNSLALKEMQPEWQCFRLENT